MKTVVFDVDGCLAGFVEGFTMLANQMFGVPIIVTWQQPSWDDSFGLTLDQNDLVWKAVRESPDFWYNLPQLVSDDIFKRIDRLTPTSQVYFVTSRVGIKVKRQTEDWLYAYGVEKPTVIVSGLKGEICKAVGATHAIDDKAGNALMIQYMSGAKAYLLHRPYNDFPHTVVGRKVERIYTVDKFLEEVEKKSG